MARGASLLATPIPPIGQAVTSMHRIRWIREQCRLYTRDLALWEVMGDVEPPWGRIEAFGAAMGFGKQCEASDAEITTAGNAEWEAAKQHATNLLEHVRRRVWSMCAARLPEATIQAAADEACRQRDSFIPDDLLNPLLLNIWQAAIEAEASRANQRPTSNQCGGMMSEAENPRVRQGFLNVVQADEQPFSLQPLRIIDPRRIPHRQWIYGIQLIRGYVTLLVAPGGTGKSSLVLAMLMSVAINRALLGEKIHQQCNVALLNLEDPQDEIDRRVTALALHYNIHNEDIAGRFFVSPAGRTVTIAQRSSDGFAVVHPDERAIIERVKDERVGVLGVDPFAESHTLEENSNPEMIQAAASWRRVAREGNCAVLLTHHVRKGLVESIEAARGAKALTDSARIGLLLSSMTAEDADHLGIKAEDRLLYARLDDAKANLAPRAPRATWLHLANADLQNIEPPYDSGDHVGVIERWQPPSVAEQLTTEQCNEALDQDRRGTG